MSEMLANTLTLDEEEAVQAELRAMQKDITKDTLPIELPAVPTMQPITSFKQGMPDFVVKTFLNHAADAISNKVAVPA
jgi:charged multivesicular body protein 6